MPSYDRALHALRTRLDSWSGIGHVTVGMVRQGYGLQLTRYDERGWRATFYTTGMEHSSTSATGTGCERTAWHARQRAAREALKKADVEWLTKFERHSPGHGGRPLQSAGNACEGRTRSRAKPRGSQAAREGREFKLY
jgi:hypothetical protein